LIPAILLVFAFGKFELAKLPEWDWRMVSLSFLMGLLGGGFSAINSIFEASAHPRASN
jgi:hypothetical protein